MHPLKYLYTALDPNIFLNDLENIVCIASDLQMLNTFDGLLMVFLNRLTSKITELVKRLCKIELTIVMKP